MFLEFPISALGSVRSKSFFFGGGGMDEVGGVTVKEA